VGKKSVTSEKIAVNGARIAFCDSIGEATYFGATPQPKEKKKHRYTLLLDPTNAAHAETIKQIKSESARIAKLFWDPVPKKLERCWGTDEDLNKLYDGFEGMFWIKLSAYEGELPIVGRRRTGPVDPKTGKPTFELIKPGHAEWPYAGSYVNSKMTLWTQDSNNRVGINGNGLTLQFMKDGAGFGRPNADPDDEFEALEDAPGGDDPTGEDDIFA
jgi:hypothetical protein